MVVERKEWTEKEPAFCVAHVFALSRVLHFSFRRTVDRTLGKHAQTCFPFMLFQRYMGYFPSVFFTDLSAVTSAAISPSVIQW